MRGRIRIMRTDEGRIYAALEADWGDPAAMVPDGWTLLQVIDIDQISVSLGFDPPLTHAEAIESPETEVTA